MDVLKNLKTLDYPDCVHKSLNLLTTFKNNKNELSEELIKQIVQDYVFTHVKTSHQYHKIKVPTYLRELQTIEIILNKFSSSEDTFALNQLFQNIFKDCHSSGVILKSLKKCVAFAVGLKNANFLNSTAFWMQNQGCCLDDVINICEHILEDYYHMSIDISPLQDLPNVSQIFTCCFIICLSNMHASNEKRLNISTQQLLDLITEWLFSNPSLGLSSLDPTKQRQTLWTSPSKPNNQTPIPGLVLWLIKQTASLKNIDVTSEMGIILSKLHLSILQTILSFPILPSSQQLDLFTLSDMQRILNDNSIIKRADAPKKKLLREISSEDKQVIQCSPQIIELIGERLSQILQVALVTGAFRCSITDLQAICNLIPDCKLLEILKNQHLSVSIPLMHNAAR